MSTMIEAEQAWRDLNDRQRLYLKAIFEEDQAAEERARAAWNPPPAAEWRWLLYSVKASKELVGRRPIQRMVERQGELDKGAGSSLAALRRRDLVETRDTWVDIGIGLAPGVEVQLTRTGRATVRAGLGIRPPRRPPAGLLSRHYLWDALAWLFEAGEEGFTHVWSSRHQPPEQPRFRPSWNTLLALQERTGGSLWEYAPSSEDRYRLSPEGRRHYETHWACYQELYPEVEAPQPPHRDGAHHGLGDHRIRKPRGLLTVAPWRLLAELARVHRAGTCPLREMFVADDERHGDEPRDLTGMPDGLLGWYITKHVTPSKTAPERLTEFKAGPLAEWVDVRDARPWWDLEYRDRPLPLLCVTAAGVAHVDEHLATYRRLYPDVQIDVPDESQEL